MWLIERTGALGPNPGNFSAELVNDWSWILDLRGLDYELVVGWMRPSDKSWDPKAHGANSVRTGF